MTDSPIVLNHDDVCRLSRLFNMASDLATIQDYRINEWLKDRIAEAQMRDPGRPVPPHGSGAAGQ